MDSGKGSSHSATGQVSLNQELRHKHKTGAMLTPETKEYSLGSSTTKLSSQIDVEALLAGDFSSLKSKQESQAAIQRVEAELYDARKEKRTLIAQKLLLVSAFDTLMDVAKRYCKAVGIELDADRRKTLPEIMARHRVQMAELEAKEKEKLDEALKAWEKLEVIIDGQKDGTEREAERL